MNDPRESMEGAPPAGQLTRSLLNVPKRLGIGATFVGGTGLTTRSLCQCGRGTEVQRHCPGDGAEWEKEMGTFSLGVSQVSAAEFSRMGGTLDCAVGLGACLLPATAPAW